MMIALLVFLLTAPTAFAAGWIFRGFRDRHRRMFMNPKNKDTARQFFDWLGSAAGLRVAALAVGLLAGCSIIYTWTADQQSEDRTDDVVACIALYVRDTSASQVPRTEASVVASDARRDWDAGESKDAPGLSKDQLKDRYLRLYARYVTVRGINPPLPEFSLSYCDGRDR